MATLYDTNGYVDPFKKTHFNELNEKTDDKYGRLRGVFEAAIDQASNGKGKERHANDDEPFEDQQIVEIAKRLSGNIAAGPLQQVVKKVYESGRLTKENAIKELLGAQNYLAAAIIVYEDSPD
jgi:hypothetical protein